MSSPANATTARADRRLVLGATVRTLGAWPSGWRYPGAHRDPHDDPRVLAETARAAEAAGLDFLFFGDWHATSAEFEHTDPYLLARIEPLAAISYLAGLTSRIGLVATISSSYAEPYATARSTASADLLSGGRIGLNIATGAEIGSARNFGWEDIHPFEARIGAAGEVVEILRGLWDSWDDDAFVADVDSGQLIDGSKVHAIGYSGSYRASAGPLNVVRPPQGHLPIAMAASSPQALDLAADHADLLLFSPRTFAEAVDAYATAKSAVVEKGRDRDSVQLLTPILPIVAATREEAWAVYDTLVDLVPLIDAAAQGTQPDLPTNRSIRALAGALGVSLTGVLLDEIVPARVAARFSDLGRSLVQTVFERSGRGIRNDRQLTYRHLLVAHAVNAPVIVGSPDDIADHLERWFLGRATDGFTVLSAFHGEQFEAFLELVVPELERRGVYQPGYRGQTLRENLGLAPATSRFTPVFSGHNSFRQG